MISLYYFKIRKQFFFLFAIKFDTYIFYRKKTSLQIHHHTVTLYILFFFSFMKEKQRTKTKSYYLSK